MRGIAEDAGISIQLLVHHVKSKEMLWHLVMEHFLGRYEAFRLKSVSQAEHASAADRLRQYISNLVNFAAHTPELHRIMTQEGGQLFPRLILLTENLTRANYKELCTLVEEAQSEGAVHPGPPGLIRFAIVAMTAVPFAVSAEDEHLTGKSPFTAGEIAATTEMICKMVLK